MTTYGDKLEPGITTDITSSAAVPTFGPAPSDVGIVGQADLENATNAANLDRVYQVTRASKAIEWFGPKSSSLLTNAVIDALNENAYPVYAVAAESTTVTGETHDSVTSAEFSFDNAPIREDEASVTVTLDGTDLNVNIVRDEVSSYSPGSSECYLNPVRGTVNIPSSPETGLSVDYDHFDYETGIDVMVENVADVIDFFLPLSENGGVVDYCNVAVSNMEQNYNLAICNGGADININDVTQFEQGYDDSRTQVVYPTRFEDGTSALASYVGFKANLNLEETPINRRLTTNKVLDETLNRAQRGTLNSEDVVPLANEPRGVRITDDPTTVSDANKDEKNLNYGFNRLVADYIIETTRDNEKPFIGKLNSQTVRNTLQSMVEEQLTTLQESEAVISYDLNIVKEDAVSVGVEMYIDLVEPLRFINNTITIGESA